MTRLALQPTSTCQEGHDESELRRLRICRPVGGGSVVFGPDACLNDDIAIIELIDAVPDSVTKYALSPYAPAEGSTFTWSAMARAATESTATTSAQVSSSSARGERLRPIGHRRRNEQRSEHPGGSLVLRLRWRRVRVQPRRLLRVLWRQPLFVAATRQRQSRAHLGGGDSGGPSFMRDANGNYILVANNTFGGNVCGWPNAAGGPTPA